MSLRGRVAPILLITVLFMTIVSTLALAAEEGDEGGEPGSTTTTVSSGLAPAVDAGEPEATPPETDWTYRYMIPTGLVLAAIVIVVTAIKYFTDVVRKRYRILEE
jgi:hypothetical protein